MGRSAAGEAFDALEPILNVAAIVGAILLIWLLVALFWPGLKDLYERIAGRKGR